MIQLCTAEARWYAPHPGEETPPGSREEQNHDAFVDACQDALPERLASCSQQRLFKCIVEAETQDVYDECWVHFCR